MPITIKKTIRVAIKDTSKTNEQFAENAVKVIKKLSIKTKNVKRP